MGSEALRSDSPAPCLQLVKEEPLAGSEHGMPGTAAQARLSLLRTCLYLVGAASHLLLALCGCCQPQACKGLSSQQQQHGRFTAEAGSIWHPQCWGKASVLTSLLC